ncbi:MAG TPA: LuxR C-terminal-related transcriptional regulator [Allosphingosinicella sp.]|jgi:two-component system response regulator FixJ
MICRTLYLVDDDPSSRRDLIGELSALDLETWPFAAAVQFSAMLGQLQPAPVLLSMDLAPEGAAFAVLEEMVATGRHWPVVAFGANPDMRTAVEAMKRGAIDFLTRPVATLDLGDALAGALALLDDIRDEEALRADAQARIACLTPRESEVANSLIGGLGNKSAAHRLGLSVRTVEMHRARLLRKLGVRSLAEAASLIAHARIAAPSAGLRLRRSLAARDTILPAPR